MLLKKTFLAVLASFYCLSVFAETEEQPVEYPLFKIEIIIFETLALRGWSEEYWPMDIDLIDTEKAIAFESLEASENMLTEQAAKMTREKGYQILLHQAWLVEAKPEEQATPLLLNVTPETEFKSAVDGYLTFYKSRYPHVIANLELERRIPTRIREEFALQQKLELEDLPDYMRFQLNESRKIKSGQLHYLDHPIFGALIQIQWQKDKPEDLKPSQPIPIEVAENPEIEGSDRIDGHINFEQTLKETETGEAEIEQSEAEQAEIIQP